MPQHSDKNCISYHIDGQDKVNYISDEWSGFAAGNKATHLTPSSVLGKPLLSLFADESTRHLYALMIDRSRSDGIAFSFPFRCDAPDVRRFMQMEIFPLADGAVGFRSCLVREERRDDVALLEADVDRSGELVKICSWCKKIEISASKWVEAEVAMQRLNLFEARKLPALTHGMCPTCHAQYLKDLTDT